MFKIVKLSKKDLNSSLEDLLKKYNLVMGTSAFPERLYLSKKDYNKLYNNIKKLFKKELKIGGKSYINYSVDAYFTTLGPNTSLQNIIKPGYAIITEI